MTKGELVKALNGWDDELEVVIRASSLDDEPIGDGDYLEITDERSFLVEYGKLTIIGDKPNDD